MRNARFLLFLHYKDSKALKIIKINTKKDV